MKGVHAIYLKIDDFEGDEQEMAKLTNKLPKTNKFGRNMYGTSYLEPVMPDGPAPNYTNWVHTRSRSSTPLSGKFGGVRKTTGRAGGVKVRSSTKRGK